MNHVAARAENQEVTRIREVIGRHRLPDFITGYDITFGEQDGEPAFWVIFHINEDRPATDAAIATRTEQLRTLRTTVMADLFLHITDRWPYYRFRLVEAVAQPA